MVVRSTNGPGFGFLVLLELDILRLVLLESRGENRGAGYFVVVLGIFFDVEGGGEHVLGRVEDAVVAGGAGVRGD